MQLLATPFPTPCFVPLFFLLLCVAVNGTEFWITGPNDITITAPQVWPNGPVTYGLYYADGYQANPTQIMTAAGNNAFVQGAKFAGNALYFFGPTFFDPDTGFTNSALWRIAGTPRTLFERPAPVYTHSAFNWMDFDMVVDGEVWVATLPSLMLLSVNGVGDVGDLSWSAVTYNRTGISNLIAVALSNSRSTVYVVSAQDSDPFGSFVYSFDVNSRSYNNGGNPILAAPANTQFRGIAPAPVSSISLLTPSGTPSNAGTSTPSNTASASRSPSNAVTPSRGASATASTSVSGSAGASASGSPAGTASPSSSVAASVTSSNSAAATPSSTLPSSPSLSGSATKTVVRSGVSPSRTMTGSNRGNLTASNDNAAADEAAKKAATSATAAGVTIGVLLLGGAVGYLYYARKKALEAENEAMMKKHGAGSSSSGGKRGPVQSGGSTGGSGDDEEAQASMANPLAKHHSKTRF